ncbi:hypothetical protein IE81DRAFT_304267 [Ceraceosorus guamensis]|uniref:Carrier domain-containing protein n=1 Tax=Ceraceosorus guamensis TaxID=1522189 RepID=A0A316VXA0_9BASI|nr:hypothetical protein IE81DRAFT_304267 [Ceraceosorus guamensis]PWN41063.1 hypothetical protein IE81DRAFT_304267 [Ceraceosorus guamensis]
MTASTPIAETSKAGGSSTSLRATPPAAAGTAAAKAPVADSLEATIALLKEISHQRFPSVADQTGLKHSRVSFSCNLDASIFSSLQNENVDAVALLRAGAYRLVTAYADSDEVLMGELERDGGTKLARPIWHEQSSIEEGGHLTWRDAALKLAEEIKTKKVLSEREMERGLREAQLRLDVRESPALFSFAAFDLATLRERWYPVNGLAVGVRHSTQGCSVDVVADAVILSERAAELFDKQLCHLACRYAPALDSAFFEEGQGNFSLAGAFSGSRASAEEKLDLLSAYEAPYDASRAHLPIAWLQKNARERPDSLAHILCEEPDSERQELTFRELDQRSTQLANWLLTRGDTEIESRIGVCRPRDAHFYVAMAAIMKAGCCYVPIDRDLPTERKAFIAKDSEAVIVLTDRDHAKADEKVFGSKGIDMSLDTSFERQVASHSSTELTEVDVALDGLAYILYTSGTTGNPKGCLQLHRGLYWAIEAMCIMPRPLTNADTDRRLAMAAVAFDVHISEIVQSWALGLCLVSVASRLSLLADLQDNIERFGITHIGMVPSMIEATLTKTPEELPIKYIVSGGEKMTDAVLSKWAAHPGIVCANFYGPTEATIGCTARRVRGVQDRRDNIGLPFEGSGAYVVDSNLRLLPRGTPGELIIEGPLVGRGYLNLPEVTKKAFVEWPRAGCRAYRTGDLVRMNHDGTILIAGRIDSQVKLRGVRIESEGVSAVIRDASTDPSIDAVTVVTSHEAVGEGSELLVTFVAINDGTVSANERRSAPALASIDLGIMATLRQAATQGLASYMRPSHIIPCKFLPLSHNGKVDTKGLIALFKQTDMKELIALQEADTEEDADVDADRPLTNLEQQVADTITSINGAKPDGIRPSKRLLECGLNSLQLAALTGLLRKHAGSTLSVAEVLSSRTIAGCAQAIENKSKVDGAQEPSDLDLKAFDRQHRQTAEEHFNPKDIESVLPPFPVQPGVLFQITQDRSAYVQHFLYEIPSQSALCNVEQISKAWSAAASRHAILRTCFVQSESALLQVVLKASADSAQAPVICSPLAHRQIESATSFSEIFRSMLAAGVARDINEDIATPSWSVHIFCDAKAPEAARYFSLSLNHALYDAFAVQALMKDVDNLLSQAPALCATPLAMEQILAQIGDSSSDVHRSFWIGELQHTTQLQSTAKRPRRGAKSTRTQRVLDIPLSDVQSTCARLGVTLQALLYGAFAFAAKSFCDWSDEAVFGTVRSGRNLPLDGIESAVCPLVTLVPTRISLRHGGIANFVETAQEGLLASLPHEHVPLGSIQGWLGARSLFDVLFSCRHVAQPHSYKHFKHLEGSPPTPEFILAIETVFDDPSDAVQVRAAFTDDVAENEVETILKSLEDYLSAFYNADEAALPAQDTRTSAHAHGSSGSSKRRTEDAEDPDPPHDVLQTVRQVTAQFLHQNIDGVAPRTSLVSLGLTSLRAVALAQKLSAAGLFVEPLDIIQAGSPRGIAVKAQSTGFNASDESQNRSDVNETEAALIEELGGTERLKLSPADAPQLAECTPLQSGMLSQTVSSGGELYVHAFPLRLNDAIDLERLESAWNVATRTFEVLRLTFHFAATHGRWCQVLHSADAVQSPWLRISTSEPSTELSKRAIVALNMGSEHAFETPPVRLLLASCESGPHHLVIALHHSLYDGVSFNNLLEHVARLYANEELPRHPSFLDAARRISVSQVRSLQYWTERMQGCNTQFLPSRNTVSGPDSTAAWRASIGLDAEQGLELQRIARRYQVTPQSIGQLALAQVLSKRSGHVDISLCQVVSGRTMREAADVIGPVFNTIPCRIALSHSKKQRNALKEINAANVDALRAQHASLRDIQRAVRVRAVSDVLFVFQPHIDTGKEHREIRDPWTVVKRSSDTDESSTQFSLNIEMHEQKGAGFAIFSSCAADVFSKADLEDLLLDLRTAITTILANPGAPSCTREREEHARTVSHKDGMHDLTNGPGNAASASASAPASALSASQQRLVEIAAQALRTESTQLKPMAKLAHLGLDSIAAIQISSRAKRVNIKLAAAQIVRAETVRALLDLVQDTEEPRPPPKSFELPKLPDRIASAAVAHLSREHREGAQALPAPAGIEYVFAGWQRSGGRSFQTAIARRFQGRLDRDALMRAWTNLLQHHSILRSTVAPTNDTEHRIALLVLAEAFSPPLEIVNLHQGEDEEVAEVVAHARAALLAPRSVREPASRLSLLQGAHDDYIVLVLPHIHYDGWSLPLLLRDLIRLYDGEEPSSPADLRPLLESFYASAHPEDLRARSWRELLGSCFAPSLLSLQAEGNPEAGSVVSHVSLEDRSAPHPDELRRVAMKEGVSASSLVLAAWAIVQARAVTSSSATFGIVQTGRSGGDSDALAQLAAPCLNLAPLHVSDLASKGDIALRVVGAARRIQQDLLSRPIEMEQARLIDVASWVGCPANPLMNVSVNLLFATQTRDPEAVADSTSSRWKPISIPHQFTVEEQAKAHIPELYLQGEHGALLFPEIQLDLRIVVAVSREDGRLVLYAEVAHQRLEEERVGKLLSEWSSLLHSLTQLGKEHEE